MSESMMRSNRLLRNEIDKLNYRAFAQDERIAELESALRDLWAILDLNEEAAQMWMA